MKTLNNNETLMVAGGINFKKLGQNARKLKDKVVEKTEEIIKKTPQEIDRAAKKSKEALDDFVEGFKEDPENEENC